MYAREVAAEVKLSEVARELGEQGDEVADDALSNLEEGQAEANPEQGMVHVSYWEETFGFPLGYREGQRQERKG